MPVVILDTVLAGNIDEKPTISKSISQEEATKDSNLHAETDHIHIGKSGPESEDDEASKKADTDMPAYLNKHPDGRHTIKTGHAVECDIMEDDHSSGPRLIQAVDITDDLKNVINNTCEYDRTEDDQ